MKGSTLNCGMLKHSIMCRNEVAMELLFLGTAAAEVIPSMYCNCDTCKIARIKKGKNIRNRSAVLINDDLCIDFRPDIFQAAVK